jgi:Fe-S-cluster containining protein
VTADDYRSLLGRLQDWFDRGRREAGGHLPCRGGCSACCHGPFDISVADAELIDQAVAGLSPADRDEVVRRAAGLLERMRALEPGWTPPYDIAELGEDRFDRLADALAAEPCPLLDEAGRCRIYHDRPLVCRLIGLAMITPAGRVIANDCPIQGRFPGYAGLAPTSFELEAFEEVEAAALGAAGRRAGRAATFETTIAAVVATGGAPASGSAAGGPPASGFPGPTPGTAPRSPGTGTGSPAPT